MKDVRGRVWRFGDNVDTDQIIPAERLVSENIDRLDDFIFEKVRPGFASEVVQGDILVAGRNFGCGSSREHAPLSLMQAGFGCIAAESFARIFYRNSMNIGLLLVECSTDIAEGDEIEVSVPRGCIEDLTSGKRYTFPEYPEFISGLIEAGGLVNAIRSGRL